MTSLNTHLFENKAPQPTTLEEERREVLDSVLQSLRAPGADGDRIAACAYLLRHLNRSGPRSRLPLRVS